MFYMCFLNDKFCIFLHRIYVVNYRINSRILNILYDRLYTQDWNKVFVEFHSKNPKTFVETIKKHICFILICFKWYVLCLTLWYALCMRFKWLILCICTQILRVNYRINSRSLNIFVWTVHKTEVTYFSRPSACVKNFFHTCCWIIMMNNILNFSKEYILKLWMLIPEDERTEIIQYIVLKGH